MAAPSWTGACIRTTRSFERQAAAGDLPARKHQLLEAMERADGAPLARVPHAGARPRRPGRTAWQDRGANALEEDLRLVEAVAAGEPIHLVGHSYGGAVALRYAMRHPHLVRSLVLYEPAVWHIVGGGAAGDRATLRVFDVGHRVAELVEGGDHLQAAHVFLDYWNGAGSFEAMGATQRERVSAQMTRVVAHFTALFLDRTPLVAYAALGMPALVMSGGAGPRSGQRSAELLATTLPRALTRRFPTLGHMGPLILPT